MTITLNMRTVNVILIKLITVVKVYLANPVTKRCRRFRDMNFLFGRGKKNLRGKDGGCGFPREFVTLRVAQHIWLHPVSMEPCDILNVRSGAQITALSD